MKIIASFILLVLAFGCKYSKGDQFYSSVQGDSLLYTVVLKGSGDRISARATELKVLHESKGNECIIKYFGDSSSLHGQKSVLLINSSLPDIKEDMLTKGYFGTFTSRQLVNYRLVSYNDFDQFFTSEKP